MKTTNTDLREQFDNFTIFEPIKGEPHQYDQYFNCDIEPDELWNWIQANYMSKKQIKKVLDE